MKSVVLLMVFALISTVSFAQRTITGTITDADNGDPLIGATVVVKGASQGTITDFDGKYSLDVPGEGAVLEFSYTGYQSQEITVGAGNEINAALAAGTLLDEVVVVGYGSQSQKEITSAVTSVSAEEFNKGPITDPAQLLQGKVAGLQVYNRGGDPNGNTTIRLRGISTIGSNAAPLVVVDGIIGASLENVDPNDIASMDILKDGSAAAIYGSRGSSGVILITTKKGSKNQKPTLSYNGQIGTSSPFNGIDVMTPQEFVAAGGTDLGSQTNWLDEVTRTGVTNVHSLALSGGSAGTSYRVSGNFRDVKGILKNSGFTQFNTRVNVNTRAFNDKLKIDFNSSFTDKKQDFGFNEALRYAVLYNPTAPVLGENSPFPFASEQFGGYFESLGLFDSFNPVSIVDQNRRDGTRREFNFGANFGYNILDNLTANIRVSRERKTFAGEEYYPVTSLFRGGATSPSRKGQANFYNEENNTQLFEAYGTYLADLGGSTSLNFTAGYSYQQNNFENRAFSLGDFPNDDIDWANQIGASQDLQNTGLIGASSTASPDEKIIAMFGRVNATVNDAIFLNASVRREGSTKLGANNRWGVFPAFGVGVDLNEYLNIDALDLFKVRLGYGVTGSLPSQNGLAQELRTIVNAPDGGVTTALVRGGNEDLKWEQKAETNLGIEVASDRFGATLDLYNRNIKDFILEVTVDVAEFGFDRQFQNAGSLTTRGAELSFDYDLVEGDNFNYNTGLILSTYSTTLDDFVDSLNVRGNLGSPGQNGTNMLLVKVGEEIGQIWGPVYAGPDAEGNPTFEDLNGDGDVIAAADKALDPNADFEVLGSGIPTLEFGWTNELSFGGWSVNAFFRGALGHSLINTYRAFYEPIVATQSSYNFVNTELAEDGLTNARFSSLYVEKANYLKLDNLTIARSFPLKDVNAISNLNVSLTGRNLLVLTNYTGTDPEPSLSDVGDAGNGSVPGAINNPDPLVPGIDRRNNYFASRVVTLGVSFDF